MSTLYDISKFSPPHIWSPGSYSPSSKKKSLSMAKRPPAMAGDLQVQRRTGKRFSRGSCWSVLNGKTFLDKLVPGSHFITSSSWKTEQQAEHGRKNYSEKSTDKDTINDTLMKDGGDKSLSLKPSNTWNPPADPREPPNKPGLTPSALTQMQLCCSAANLHTDARTYFKNMVNLSVSQCWSLWYDPSQQF